jgi:hypothetical protein
VRVRRNQIWMMRIMPLLKYQRILKWRWKMIQPMSTNTYPLMPNRVQSLMVPTSSKFTKDLKWKFAEVTEGSVPFTNIKSLYVGQTQLASRYWGLIQYCF